MGSENEYAFLNVITKKKGKTNKKLTWTYQDTEVFAEVISDPIYRRSDYTIWWATILERLAFKKSSDKRKDIEEIQEALKNEFEARDMEAKEFTVKQLSGNTNGSNGSRNTSEGEIKFGSGLSWKETVFGFILRKIISLDG